jgi:hypothetical protein
LRLVWRVFGLFRTLESFEKAEHDLAW